MNRSPEAIEKQLLALAASLRRGGLSVTHQRLAVYRALLEDDSHPDAEQLYERVRGALPGLSLGTVYKAIDVLLELGVIREVDAPRSATRYEAALEPHHHLICDRCHRIEDLFDPGLSNVRPAPGSGNGFEAESCAAQFHGACAKCAAALRARGENRRARGHPSA